MERQASFLRCSKLNCYAEFNKMVQALSVHSRSFPSHNATGTLKQPDKGTGSEYNFYQTLSIMLQQVLSNPDQNAQRSELKMIYQWFTLNKPLAPQKIKPNARRPKLAQSSRRTALLSTRPQTAPAALYGNYTSSKNKTPPICPPSTPSLSSFASSYMTRLIKPSPPTTDQLMSQRTSSPSLPSSNTRPASQPLPVRKDWLVDVIDSSDGQSNVQPHGRPNTSAIVDNSSLLVNGLTAGSVLDNATSVAAQMTMDRIMTKMDNSRVIFSGAVLAKETTNIMPQSIKPPGNSQAISSNHEAMKQQKPSASPPQPSPPRSCRTPPAQPSPPRSRTPSMERSVSMTILETIKEDDDEAEIRATPMMKTPPATQTAEKKDGQEQHDSRETMNDIVKDTGSNDNSEDVNHGEEQTDKATDHHEEVPQVPKVTISNNTKKSRRLSRTSSGRSSSDGSRSRLSTPVNHNPQSSNKTVCQVQVVNLSFSTNSGAVDSISTLSTDNRGRRRSATRVPRKLVPIVAGFNQQHYRPRTVGVCMSSH